MNFLDDPSTLKWLFLDLNSYFASVEQQDRPELRNRPVAVVPSMTDATCAIAASYEAKAYGVKTGTKIYEAKKMCPDLVCVLARHDIYVEYHHKIMDELERNIPIHKICSVDEASCKLSPDQYAPEKATALALQIKRGLNDSIGSHIKCSIGLASNAFLAKTATNMQKPDGLVILDPLNMKERLFALDLKDLTGIGPGNLARLQRANIHTIEDLWSTSPKHARHIWGSVAGEKFWYNLRGYDVPNQETKKSVVGHSRVLDPVHRNLEGAYQVIRRLTTKACARLRRYNIYATKMTVSVKTGQGKGWAKETSFSALQDNTRGLKILNDLWCLYLQANRRHESLLKVSITFHGLVEPAAMTGDLFEVKHETKMNAKLSQAVDLLNKKFGGEAVTVGFSPKTKSGHLGTKIAFNRIPDKAEFLE